MEVTFREDAPGAVTAEADLHPSTGVVGARIVLNTNLRGAGHPTREVEALVIAIVEVLTSLGLAGEVRFRSKVDSSGETGAVVDQVLAAIPTPVVIPTGPGEHARPRGLRRGLSRARDQREHQRYLFFRREP